MNIYPAFALFVLACFAFSSVARGGAPVCQEGCDPSDNTFLGLDALTNNTGVNNTAVGAFALLNNTSGDYNTATGEDALASNETGSGNTATGVGALSSSSIGSNNTGTGYLALGFATGSNNTATGFGALYGDILSFFDRRE
jgi:hypothetical protein